MIKKIASCMLLLLTSLVLMLSYSNAKYYSKSIAQIWETNFAAFNVVDPGSEKLYYTIGGQTSDNPQSMFNGDSRLTYNSYNGSNAESHRWTNWSSTGANKGEKVTIVLTFVDFVTISKLRLYYFVDHQYCDLPLALDMSYYDDDTKQTVDVLLNASLEDIDRNFDKATDRDSIFRTWVGSGTIPSSSIVYPVYYMDHDYDGVKKDVDIIAEARKDTGTSFTGDNRYFDYPHSIIYFNKDSEGNVNTVKTNKITLVLHTAPNWYTGLIEIAMDWKFVDDVLVETLGSSPWYGLI